MKKIFKELELIRVKLEEKTRDLQEDFEMFPDQWQYGSEGRRELHKINDIKQAIDKVEEAINNLKRIF